MAAGNLLYSSDIARVVTASQSDHSPATHSVETSGYLLLHGDKSQQPVVTNPHKLAAICQSVIRCVSARKKTYKTRRPATRLVHRCMRNGHPDLLGSVDLEASFQHAVFVKTRRHMRWRQKWSNRIDSDAKRRRFRLGCPEKTDHPVLRSNISRIPGHAKVARCRCNQGDGAAKIPTASGRRHVILAHIIQAKSQSCE